MKIVKQANQPVSILLEHDDNLIVEVENQFKNPADSDTYECEIRVLPLNTTKMLVEQLKRNPNKKFTSEPL
jgi:hypothetical protein